MKKWDIKATCETDNFIEVLIKNRGITQVKEPQSLTASDVGIDEHQLVKAIERIKKAIADKESIVVYADYDADGITAGAVLWETLYAMGANCKPYIPHRIDEGYGLSVKGIEAIKEQHAPTLIVTVDHGITAWEKVEYAKSLGIDLVVTDHHVKPEKLPDCVIVHTTKLSGAGISWFLSKELLPNTDVLELAAIGTIADMVPLVGPNRSIVKFGLEAINKTKRVGLLAIMKEAGLVPGCLGVYEVSHLIAPRLNAMGRIVHAMDALRLLCTKNETKATSLAQTLGLTNRERQQLTLDTVIHARELYQGLIPGHQGSTLARKKLIFLSHESYNQGVIGLVAGKLVEEFYRPAIVVSLGEKFSKGSARSITGFNIVEAIRSCSDLLVDVGGHPMAAGFTAETKNLRQLQDRLELVTQKEISDDILIRTLTIDAQIPLKFVNEGVWQAIRPLEPFGFGNPEPVFCSTNVQVTDARLVGTDGRHLKLRIKLSTVHSPLSTSLDAIAFGLGSLYGKLQPPATIDIAYTIDMNVWNGKRNLQLKIKDIHGE